MRALNSGVATKKISQLLDSNPGRQDRLNGRYLCAIRNRPTKTRTNFKPSFIRGKDFQLKKSFIRFPFGENSLLRRAEKSQRVKDSCPRRLILISSFHHHRIFDPSLERMHKTQTKV